MPPKTVERKDADEEGNDGGSVRGGLDGGLSGDEVFHMNLWSGAGRVGKDSDLREFGDQKLSLSFSLATSKKFNGKEETQWHNIVLYGPHCAKLAQYITKGVFIVVWNAETRYRTYDDKDGVKRYVTEQVGGSITFGPKAGAGAAGTPGAPDEDQIPFDLPVVTW